MRFGGFQPFTLSDYPGRMAAIAFTQGCNFRCPFCHNGALLPMAAPEETLVPEAVVLDHLYRRRGKLDGLVVSGGEPTLQKALPGFLRRVKDLGFLVKLDTNGSRPDVLRRLLEDGLVDFVAMDIKATPEKYGRLSGVDGVSWGCIEESIAAVTWSGVEHLFRTTMVPALLTPQDLHRIRELLPESSPHKIQQFNPENALEPALCTAVETA